MNPLSAPISLAPAKELSQKLGDANERTVSGKKTPKSRDDIDPEIRKAAEGLESLFMDTMFRTMRGTVQKSELSLENSATGIYRGMLDSEIAKTSAKQNSIGLADQIVAYLESRGYNNSSSQARTGGTYESKSKQSIDPVQHSVHKTGNENGRSEVHESRGETPPDERDR